MNTDNILETLKVTPQNVSNVIKSYSYIIDERYKDIPTIDVLSANMIYSCLIVQKWIKCNSEKNPENIQTYKEAAHNILKEITIVSINEFINTLYINPTTGACEEMK